MPPSEPSITEPIWTPETLNVPFAVDGTYSVPFQVPPVWTFPVASVIFAATMYVAGPVPPVRSRKTLRNASPGSGTFHFAFAVTATGTVFSEETATDPRPRVTAVTVRLGSGVLTF